MVENLKIVLEISGFLQAFCDILISCTLIMFQIVVKNLKQVQNFPQLVIKFILKNIRTDTMVAGSNFSWQGIKRKAVYTEGAGLVCKCTGHCTLEGSVK